MYKKTMVCAFALSVVALQACTTVNPYTREEESAKATKGAAIGAAVGAMVGIATSDGSRERKERALKGAGIGALTGGGVGYYMDVQETKLRQELEGTGVSVSREGERVILNMPGNITFDVDKTKVKPDFVDVLGSVSKILKEYKKTMIEVAGHTDSSGSDRYNQLLSEQRAQSVTNHLIDFGVERVRIDTVGYGEAYPIASNDTASGRQQNRRVELTLLPYVEE